MLSSLMAMVLMLEILHGYQYKKCMLPKRDCNGDGIREQSYVFKGLSSTIVATGFLVFGVLTLCALKTNFSKFYQENFSYVLIATLVLSMPLYVRGIRNIATGVAGNLP